MFHGTDFPIEKFDLDSVNPSSGRFDICLTDDDGIAEMYATRFEGMGDGVPTIIEFEIDGAKIADESTALEILGYDDIVSMNTSDVFHAIDEGRDQIVAAGFDAVRYTDCLPGTADRFECVRVYSRDAVEIVDSWEV